jgi:hypothetical protein
VAEFEGEEGALDAKALEEKGLAMSEKGEVYMTKPELIVQDQEEKSEQQLGGLFDQT